MPLRKSRSSRVKSLNLNSISRRGRCARHHFLTDCLSDSHANARMRLKFMRRLPQGKGPDVLIETLEKFLPSTLQGPHKLALILSRGAKRSLAMDRYERRAH
jgi:hypothetical protein